MEKKKKSPLHIGIRRKVFERMSALKTSNGYLPSERELSKSLKVSRGTLRKAIEQLIKEGHIVNNPRKGNYVSSVKPALKVGIIFGNGETPMHVQSTEILKGELEVLSDLHCRIQFINLRKNPEKELGKCDLDGIIWNDPGPNMFGFIRDITEKGVTPLAAQTLMHDVAQALIFDLLGYRIPIQKNFVTLDYPAVGKLRADYFIRQGVSRVAYLGDMDNAPTLNTFIKTFVAAGNKFDKKWHIKNIEDIPELLPEILDTENITGIVSNGDHIRIENLFRVLEKRQMPKDFKLMIDYIDGLPDILSRYPGVKVSAINRIPYFEIGKTTAGVLLEQIRTGTAKTQVLLKTEIQEFRD